MSMKERWGINMKSGIEIGKIKEIKIENKIAYSLNFYDNTITKDFSDKNKLLDFITSEVKELFSHKQNHLASISYKNIEGIKHYFVIREIEDEIYIAEETKYEYANAHPYLFRRNTNLRVINDRNYDFSDIVRASANYRVIFMWLKIFILFLSTIVSVILLVETIDVVSSDKTLLDTSQQEIITSLNVFMSFAISIISIGSLYYATRVYNEENTNSNFNFRKATVRRQKIRLLNCSMQLIVVGLLGYFLYYVKKDGFFDNWNYLSILGITNLSLAILGFLSQVTYILLIRINLKRLVKIYFPKIPFSKFKKWYKKEKIKEEVGSRNIFLLSDHDSINFYTQEVELSNSMKHGDNEKEFKSHNAKLRTQLKKAIDLRKKDINKK